MTIELYNFRKPGPLASDLEQRLAAWLRDFCTQAPEKLARRLSLQVEIKFQGLEMIRPAEGLTRLPDTSIGYRVSLNEQGASTLLLLPRTLALLLVGAAVGEPAEQLPADREMTVVEESLCEYLVQQFLLAVMQETWPGTEPLDLVHAWA